MKNAASDFHVIYIITKLELGGAQKVCLNLKEGLEKRHLSTSLISGSQGVLVEQAQKLTSVYLLKSFKREVSISQLFLEIANFFSLIKILRKIKKQHPHAIVHTHSTKAGLLGRWAAFFAGIKTRVHTVHGYGFHDYQPYPFWLFTYLLERITAKITTHFVCVSNKDQITGTKYFSSFGQKSSIIRAAVEWDAFEKVATHKEKSSDKHFTIGTVACFKPQKNLLDLFMGFANALQTLPAQKKKQIHLEVIGDGKQRTILEKWIKENKLNNNIHLLGWQSDVSKWMQTWDVFALSSLWEGLPCAVIEARLCKIPVVAYNVGGIAEVIQHKKNGFLVTPKDTQELSRRLKLLITNPVRCKQMGDFQDDLEQFHVNSMINAHISLYKKLTKRAHAY
ncbi:MAG: glycosyltransferase [Epsilonproteobacteria bacterium]|nr:glycosyltransferase [Campylobacterota bacterium]